MGENELNKRAVENFIKCGAMDCFGYHRSELLAVYDSMMDSIASTRKRNLDGQIGLFGMFDDDSASTSIPIPSLPEMKKADLMLMEKETTGIYLSGHPMDEYRHLLRNTRVVPIAQLLDGENGYKDDQIVSVAGVIQSFKLKTTRNNSSMAYVTLEDDTAAMEMLAFSNTLNQYGSYIRENEPVVISGRLSMRDDKDPQIVINRIRAMSDFASGGMVHEPVVPESVLYLRLPSEEGPLFNKIKAMLNMFPGENKTVVYFEDTKIRRGTRCKPDERLITELINVLGLENVVLK
jgi:DNA polymerase-3 subunit alpha